MDTDRIGRAGYPPADIGDVHGDAWTARIRAQHEAAGEACPCGNGHKAEPDPAGDEAARHAAEASWPTLARDLGATVDFHRFEGGRQAYVAVPGYRRQGFTAYDGDDETLEQKVVAWLAFCRDFNASAPKGA